MILGWLRGDAASASVPDSPRTSTSSPMFQGPINCQSPVAPFGGKGGGGGGGGACDVDSTLTLPGDATTDALLALNQQRPCEAGRERWVG